MSQNANIVAQRWAFTINNPTEEEIEMLRDIELANADKKKRLLVAELEHTGEDEGTPHIQGYVEFIERTTRKKVCRWLGERAHIEKAMGNRASNIKYCTKEGGDHIIINWNDPSMNALVQKQLEKEDPVDADEKAREILEDIGQLDEAEFEAKYPRFYLRNYNKYKELQHVKQQKRQYTFDGNLQEKNLWIFGPTGTGKSKIAHDGIDPTLIYFKNINKWWNGYEHGVKRVIIEDYPSLNAGGNALVQHMKIWADRYTFTGEIKGAHSNIAPSFNLIVTSNYRIEECFANPEDVAAIKRRFHEVYFNEAYAEECQCSYQKMLELEFPQLFEHNEPEAPQNETNEHENQNEPIKEQEKHEEEDWGDSIAEE